MLPWPLQGLQTPDSSEAVQRQYQPVHHPKLTEEVPQLREAGPGGQVLGQDHRLAPLVWLPAEYLLNVK